MAKRRKYDFDRLNTYCQENSVTLLEDYSNADLTSTSTIKGNCIYENCKNEFNKKYEGLLTTGGYCKICIKNIANDRRRAFCLEKYGVNNITKRSVYKDAVVSPKFNYSLLQNYCNENNITLLGNYENEKLNARFVIKGECSNKDCSNIFNKKFCKLINTNALCKPCIFIKANVVRKTTNLKEIGQENYFQCELIKNNIKEIIIKKYGVEHVSQSNEIQDKIKKTNLTRYGFEHHSHNKNVQNKITETNISRYGVEHLMKDPDYLENMLKKSHEFKKYILPSGKIINYQGYENFALDELIINDEIDESDIITGCANVPKILYIDENNKTRAHFVDIYIPSQNRLIEVKSTWTFTKCGVLLKQKAAKELGYNYEIWVYDKKKNKTCYD